MDSSFATAEPLRVAADPFWVADLANSAEADLGRLAVLLLLGILQVDTKCQFT